MRIVAAGAWLDYVLLNSARELPGRYLQGDVFDARIFSTWGRVEYAAAASSSSTFAAAMSIILIATGAHGSEWMRRSNSRRKLRLHATCNGRPFFW